MQSLDELLRIAMEKGGSDVFIIPFSQVSTKVHGQMVAIAEEKDLTDIRTLIDRAYELAHRNQNNLERVGDDDFSFAIRDVSRFRCNIYRQRDGVVGWKPCLGSVLQVIFTPELSCLKIIRVGGNVRNALNSRESCRQHGTRVVPRIRLFVP